jgi:CRP/FNR family transcriptional regulator, cyclic AMP receptor protein
MSTARDVIFRYLWRRYPRTSEMSEVAPACRRETMHWIDFLGYAAAASVLVTFCMSTMLPLRVVAISSNVLFATYGATAHIYPVLALHLILLPVNIIRLIQILRLTKGVKTAQLSGLSIENLLPLMRHRVVKAGQALVNKGDKADHMYYLHTGTMRISEVDKTIEPGAVFGEIGVFAREQKRTATVICISDCDIYELSESRAKLLYYQNPSFGFALIQLIIARLLDNNDLLQVAPGAT